MERVSKVGKCDTQLPSRQLILFFIWSKEEVEKYYGQASYERSWRLGPQLVIIQQPDEDFQGKHRKQLADLTHTNKGLSTLVLLASSI